MLRLGPTSPGRNRQGSNTVRLVAIEIVFETHATTEDNERGIATGWLPGRLSPRGRAQAEQLGDRRRPDGIHTVFTSDLGRAVETAAIAFGSTEIPILADWRLRRVRLRRAQRDSRGVVRGPARRAHRRALPRRRELAGGRRPGPRFLDDLPTRWGGERVLVIGHSATRWALDHLLDAKALEEIVDADFAWQEGAGVRGAMTIRYEWRGTFTNAELNSSTRRDSTTACSTTTGSHRSSATASGGSRPAMATSSSGS